VADTNRTSKQIMKCAECGGTQPADRDTCTFCDKPLNGPLEFRKDPEEPPYYVQTFWSPDRRYLVTAHATLDGIVTLQDDNGQEWEAASRHQNMGGSKRSADETSEPPVMGAGGGLSPMPTALEAIEAHVRQIQILCDETGRDPTEWLSDNAAQGETGDRTQLHGALVRIVLEAEGCPPACSHEFHKLAIASVIKIGKDALTRVRPEEPACTHPALTGTKAWKCDLCGVLCEDCPPVGYPTDETRCTPCPRSADKATQPLPDHLKPPVKAGDPCPAIDDAHTEHEGKCVYCGAPMAQVKASEPISKWCVACGSCQCGCDR